jgi:NADH-quinone oxidoreductase subunit N
MLNAAAAAFYYLRVVVVMYMRDSPEGAPTVTAGPLMRIGLATTAIATVIIGVLPPVTSAVIGLAQEAAAALL